jgi:hypothetical protein
MAGRLALQELLDEKWKNSAACTSTFLCLSFVYLPGMFASVLEHVVMLAQYF